MFGAQAPGLQGFLKEGSRQFSGVDEALLRNIEACKNLATITKSSLGPDGMNKLIVNHLGKHFATSSTTTIVNELEVAHPAAKILVMAAKAQEQECGDAVNLVVSFGGELLKGAEELLKQGIHANDIIKGYSLANDKILEHFDSYVCWTCQDVRNEENLVKCMKSALSAKQMSIDELAPLVAKACVMAMPPQTTRFEEDKVRVTKIVGGSMSQSSVVQGMVLVRKPKGTVTKKAKAKVAVFQEGIDSTGTETKGTVLLENADALKNFTKGEEQNMEKTIQNLADAGVEVLISGTAVSEIAQHFLDKYSILTLHIPSKFELRRIVQTVGATSVLRAGVPLPEELGYLETIEAQEHSSQTVTVLTTRDSRIATVLLRSATPNVLDEMERAVNNAVSVVKASCRDPRFVAGAGATEVELAHFLQGFGSTVHGLDQYAVLKFAEALEVVPRILAENAGHNHVEAITALYAAHQKGEKFVGIDVEDGAVTVDAVTRSILDHSESKKWALRFCIEAVLTVLQVDQIIMAKQAGGPKAPEGGGGRDED